MIKFKIYIQNFYFYNIWNFKLISFLLKGV